MAQHPLDRIIIRANADTQPHDGGKIVMIDRKTGTRLLKKPPWGFWKEVDYYLVFRESVKREGLTHDIDDFENDRTIQIQIDYQATCLPNKEEDVVGALYDSDTLPSVVLENKIIGWVKAFTTRWEREFIDNYQEKIKELQNNMEQRAETEVFLSIKFRLTSNIQLPSSLLIGPQKFSVQVTDYPKNLDCEVDGELGVLDEKTAHNRRDRLEAIMEREIKSYMAKHVKLHDYYFGSDEQLIPGIKTYLDGVFASQGRQVERLFIKREKPSFSNDVREITKGVKYQVQERPEPVTIVSTLQMELQDAGQYVATDTPNLEKWVQRELDNIIPKVLFGMKYIDLLLSFKPKEADIKDYMEKQAKNIGYSLRALLSVPNLEQLKLLKNFDINVPGTTPFSTKIDQAEVKLEISATVRIQNLKDIEIYLNQQQDVTKLMTEAILNETKRFLRSIEPEDFYMHFGFTVDGEKGVEQNLIELLTEKLSNEFKATVIKVDLKRLNTEITDRLRELEKSLPEGFEFEINPLSGGEPIGFFGDFQVEGVDPNGWYQFQKRTFSIQHIRVHIQKTAQRKLRTFASEHLEYRWHEEQEDIQKAMAHIMQPSATEVFGVAIRVLNFDREMTDLDQQRNKLRRELEKKKLLRLEREMEDKQERQEFEKELKQLANDSEKKRYEQLLKKREEIIEDGLIDDDEELADLEAEILKKSKTTDENKSNEDELLRELDALEDSRPRKTRSRELLTRITQNEGTEKALPGATSRSEVEEVENLPKSKNGIEEETQIDGDIADAEIISFNKPAQPPQSEETETEKNKPIK